jgi:hypothetical protein
MEAGTTRQRRRRRDLDTAAPRAAVAHAAQLHESRRREELGTLDEQRRE